MVFFLISCCLGQVCNQGGVHILEVDSNKKTAGMIVRKFAITPKPLLTPKR